MLRVVTRKSPLAMMQTKMVVKALEDAFPAQTFKILPITTDSDQNFGRLEGKNSFVKELEQALVSGVADFAVHSLKDLSCIDQYGLMVAACLERHEARDVFVSVDYPDLACVPQGSMIGTCSLRRSAQLALHYPHLRPMHCRGNIDTRIEKMKRGDYAGIVLAGAGVERLGLEAYIAEYLPTKIMVPSCAQGVIGVQCRIEDTEIRSMLKMINHEKTAFAVSIERKVVAMLGANCLCPLGVYAIWVGPTQLRLTAMLAYEDGDQAIYHQTDLDSAYLLDLDVALQVFVKELLARGAGDILDYHSSLTE